MTSEKQKQMKDPITCWANKTFEYYITTGMWLLVILGIILVILGIVQILKALSSIAVPWVLSLPIYAYPFIIFAAFSPIAAGIWCYVNRKNHEFDEEDKDHVCSE